MLKGHIVEVEIFNDYVIIQPSGLKVSVDEVEMLN